MSVSSGDAMSASCAGDAAGGCGLLGPGAARTCRHAVVAVSSRRRDLTQDTCRHVLELFQAAWRASPPESYDVAPSVTATAVSYPDVLSIEVKDQQLSGHQEKQKLEQIPVESRGPASYLDFRGLCRLVSKHTLKTLCLSVFEEPEDPSSRSFFSEIISSISDVKFSHSGRYMMTRDYLSVKVWDLNMESRPVETHQVRPLLGTAPRPHVVPSNLL